MVCPWELYSAHSRSTSSTDSIQAPRLHVGHTHHTHVHVSLGMRFSDWEIGGAGNNYTSVLCQDKNPSRVTSPTN